MMRQLLCVERLGERNRLLVGLGIPLVGGFLLIMLFRLLHIRSASGDVFAFVVIALLCGIGSYFVARWFALVVVPLLVLSGILVALDSGCRSLCR